TVTVSGNTISEAREIQMSNSSVIRGKSDLLKKHKFVVDEHKSLESIMGCQDKTSNASLSDTGKGRRMPSNNKVFSGFHVVEGKWIIDDPVEILQSVKRRISKAIDKATADGYNFDNGLKAIGVTDKRKTTIICNESTGVPLYNVIVMMDVRTTLICRLPCYCYLQLATVKPKHAQKKRRKRKRSGDQSAG
ncbi:glycerol kinase, partial [Tanacetum coccineum]